MSKKAILIVDDEKDIFQLLRYNLEKEGYTVLGASTGEEGLRVARLKKPDLVMLDLMLPQIDGFEVCRLLKADKQTKNIPILILTAKNSESDQVVGLELGATDYLTKPFSIKVLLVRLKNILRASRTNLAEPQNLLTRGHFWIDRENFIFKIDAKPVALTKKEFQILAILMENATRVVSRDLLVSAVWGEGVLVSSVSMNMHIKSLRDKLGRHAKAIQTVRGVGFRFE